MRDVTELDPAGNAQLAAMILSVGVGDAVSPLVGGDIAAAATAGAVDGASQAADGMRVPDEHAEVPDDGPARQDDGPRRQEEKPGPWQGPPLLESPQQAATVAESGMDRAGPAADEVRQAADQVRQAADQATRAAGLAAEQRHQA